MAKQMLEQIKAISDVIIDGYFVIDPDRTILHFNQAFYAMLPRGVSRNLKGKKCHDALNLEICKERCIAHQCWEARKHMRLDEISGKVAKTDKRLTNEDGSPQGALVIQRNVTDEAQVQTKYKEMLDNEKRERDRLMHIIRARTKDLLETSQKLLGTQKELMDYRRGRRV
jgi:PAS domain-containing protein